MTKINVEQLAPKTNSALIWYFKLCTLGAIAAAIIIPLFLVAVLALMLALWLLCRKQWHKNSNTVIENCKLGQYDSFSAGSQPIHVPGELEGMTGVANMLPGDRNSFMGSGMGDKVELSADKEAPEANI